MAASLTAADGPVSVPRSLKPDGLISSIRLSARLRHAHTHRTSWNCPQRVDPALRTRSPEKTGEFHGNASSCDGSEGSGEHDRKTWSFRLAYVLATAP